jgi:hypothetical protein
MEPTPEHWLIAAQRRHEYARAFLEHFASGGYHEKGVTLLEVFNLWFDDKWPHEKERSIMREMLLQAVCYTPDGKTRVLLARGTKPDKFTGAKEAPAFDVPPETVKSIRDGELSRRVIGKSPDGDELLEPLDEYVGRLAAGLGFEVSGTPYQRVMPDVTPAELEHERIIEAGGSYAPKTTWMPYKEQDDDLSDIAPPIEQEDF